MTGVTFIFIKVNKCFIFTTSTNFNTMTENSSAQAITSKITLNGPKITPFLWFDDNAEEAVNLYTSVFENSKVISMNRYGEAGPGPKGMVMIAKFELAGQEFLALNGGPMFKFNESVSLVVNCETQQEVDYLWEKLSEGGEQRQCAWLKDKFGLFWQIVPLALGKLMSDRDPVKSQRVMKAMLKMNKIIIKDLEDAYDGK